MLAQSRRSRLARSLAAAAAVSGGLYVADKANAQVYSRSARVFATGASVVVDYRRNLRGTAREDPAYREKLSALNQRVADRLLRLCFQNGGIYTKFGQQLATFNHGLPKEYTQTLATLQDQAKPVAFDLARRTIEEETGRPWTELFQDFDREPIASASLAQVHRAVDRSGREVAVKVQYPHLASQIGADLTVMRWAVQLTEYFFPDVQLQWMFPEFERALAAELDFDNEKRNNRRVAACFAANPAVHVPVVYDELSSRRMLTMEFIRAPKISQVGAIESLGLDPGKVAHVLCEVFSEMIFCHGFVHCDPHAGNIFVRPNPDPAAAEREQLVLLDHGLYRELDEGFRRTYCDLWRAMLLRDAQLLQECGDRLNVGELVQFLPLMFTYRPLDHKGRLDESMTKEEREKLGEKLRGLRVADVWDFMEQLPRDMLFVFRTNNMIRALNKDLGGTTQDRFSVMGKYAAQGHTTFYATGAEQAGAWSRAKYWWDHSNLVLRLRVIDYAMSLVRYWRGEERAKLKHVG